MAREVAPSPILLRVLTQRSLPIDFASDIWVLSSDRFAVYSETRVVDWRIEIGKGELLTDAVNFKLLLCAKEAMLIDMRSRGGGSDLSTRATLRRLVRICRWMKANKIDSFAEMDAYALHDFLKGLSDSMRENHDVRKQIQPFFTLFERIKADGELLKYPLPKDCKVRPIEVYALKSPKGSKNILFPDEKPLIRLLTRAASMVDGWLDDLLQLREDYISSLNEPVVDGSAGKVWRALVDGRPKLQSDIFALTGLDISSKRNGARLVALIYNACFVLIAGLTGMRLSELLRLEVGCIVTVIHSDGLEYQYLKGVRAKKKDARSKEGMWLAPPLAIRAVQVLERLRAPLKFANTNRLSVSYAVKGIWPLDVERAEVRSIHERSMVARINSLTTVGRERINWHFTTHQLRRGFCRFVALRDKRGLLALAEQYGHVHWGTTDAGYVGTDFQLESLMEEEELEELTRAMTGALEATGASGAGFERLRGSFDSLSGRVATEKKVRALIESGVIMVPCDWGYCVYRADLSACKGTEVAPNPLGRSPEVCAGCKNFGVDERHIEWWSDRLARGQEFARIKGVPWQSLVIVKKRVEVAGKVVEMISKGKDV